MLRTAACTTRPGLSAGAVAKTGTAASAGAYASPVLFSPHGVRHGGGELKILKTRLTSVKSVAKITKSMNMIAASKLTKAQNKVKDAAVYSSSAEHMLNSQYPAPPPIDPEKPEPSTDAMFESEEYPSEGKQLIITVCSDRGLCGSANTSIIKQANRLLARDKDLENTKIVTIGDKARSGLAMKYSKNFAFTVAECTGNKGFSFADVLNITDEIVNVINENDIERVNLIYNKFQTVVLADLLVRPFPSMAKFTSEESYSEFEFDLERELVLRDQFEFTLANVINGALLNSQCWELASRMSAMDGATRNANDMIKRLEITYNRKRQAAITTDITEIVSGAAAVEGFNEE